MTHLLYDDHFYVGPDKELSQVSVFSELRALFPRVRIRLELVGPAVPQYRSDSYTTMYLFVGGLKFGKKIFFSFQKADL